MTRVFLIRHGETEWNKKRIMQGSTDIPLNETGLEQAKKLGNRFKDIKLDAIYSSRLKRASQTAQKIAKHQNLEVQEIEDLNERNYGILEGKSGKELKTPPLKEINERRRTEPDFKIPDGESFQEFQNRVTVAIIDIIENQSGCNIAIVVHGAVKRALLIKFLDKKTRDEIESDGIQLLKMRTPNTSVTELDFSEDPKLIKLACTKHLD